MFLSKQELIVRCLNSQAHKRQSIKKVANLSRLVKNFIDRDGFIVSDDKSQLFKSIITQNEVDFKEDTPQWLLWEQQHEQASKDPRAMRWHPLIIRWCLSIYYSSPAAYKQLNNKNLSFIKLPHVNTLKKYINFTSPQSGFDPAIISLLCDDSGIDDLPSFKKNVVISFDEMKIKSDLIYRKSTGELVGFTQMGDINEEFASFERTCESTDVSSRQFAAYVLVFMVRGIFSKLAYPFGYFASMGFTADQLYPCVMEATRVLQSIGFMVRALVCDGASPNRKLFQMLNMSELHWTTNWFSCGEKIFLFSDVPHLIKTTRNCFENSCWNKKTRNLHVSSKVVLK